MGSSWREEHFSAPSGLSGGSHLCPSLPSWLDQGRDIWKPQEIDEFASSSILSIFIFQEGLFFLSKERFFFLLLFFFCKETSITSDPFSWEGQRPSMILTKDCVTSRPGGLRTENQASSCKCSSFLENFGSASLGNAQGIS